MRTILLNSNKYALNKWYDQVKKLGAQSGEYLDFGGIREHHIRPVASEALALAVSLKFGVYDPAVTGVSGNRSGRQGGANDCLARGAASGECRRQRLGTRVAERAVGQFRRYGGLAAVGRPDAAGSGSLVRRMAVDEADRLIDYEVPYYRDANGKVVFKGDSKAEENSWNSTILVIAAAMMPEHPHWKGWYDKSVELRAFGLRRTAGFVQ